MQRALAVVTVLAACAAAGCESGPRADRGASVSDVMRLGDQYESPVGCLFVIRVQDEYRLIRSVSSGPISHGYEDLFAVPRDQVKFNRWLGVEKAPGLELAIVSPEEVAFRFEGAGGDGK
jgi:hypothetical protein